MMGVQSSALPGGHRWTLWLTICGVPSALGRETEVKTTDWFHHSKQMSKHNNSELWFGDMLRTLEWTGLFELNPTDFPISWKLLKQFVSVRGRPERLTETQYKHTSCVLWEWSQTKIKCLNAPIERRQTADTADHQKMQTGRRSGRNWSDNSCPKVKVCAMLQVPSPCPSPQ